MELLGLLNCHNHSKTFCCRYELQIYPIFKYYDHAINLPRIAFEGINSKNTLCSKNWLSRIYILIWNNHYYKFHICNVPNNILVKFMQPDLPRDIRTTWNDWVKAVKWVVDVSGKWRFRCQKQVSQARISNCIPQYSVGCNYLSMPEIPASGAKSSNVM